MLDDPEREGWLPTAAVIELLDVPSGSRVLDFGTGTGRYGVAFAHAHPDVCVVAYDVQPEMLDIVRRRKEELGLENFVAASWEETQARAPYDRIFALNVLHEIDDATLRSLAPLLAPRGDVLIFDWDATIDRPTGPPAEHAHSPAEGWDRIARSGLRCIEGIRDPRIPYHFIVRATRRR
ncbi:MAG TPA: class I SAM-dependent methyltransferase [Candidatus Binatia bacterium]|nr:class I SAM-dependent methyltransferase [Candidatus Binatia bacterium]